ncbi:hypothetical protein [Streptomyces sp. NPDC053541]|uniref:hypothetical protein n=1 Tax=Streptomyces sp. NPDC053541 TaxID=3365709 RepID=UPI0037CDE855
MRARHAPPVRLVPALLLPALLLVVGPRTVPTAHAGGAGADALALSVTVNTVPGTSGDVRVRTGGTVVKRYRLVNRGEADLYGVTVRDPAVPGGRAHCPRTTLGPLRSLVCTARFPALPGRHAGTARATGDIPSLAQRATARARSGYEGVGGALTLAEAVRVGPPAPGTGAGPGAGRTATVRYTVGNRGNRPVHALRLTDPGFGAGPGGLVCTLPELAPGASADCTATVRRGPGTHRSAGLAGGTDRLTTVGERGERLPPPPLTARASAAFRVAAPPPPPPPPAASRPSRPPRPPGPSAPSTGAPGAPGAPGVPGAPGAPGTAGATATRAAAVAAATAAAVEAAVAEALRAAEAAAAAEAAEAAEAAALGGAAVGGLPPGAVPPGAAEAPGAAEPAAPPAEARVPAAEVPPGRPPAVRPPPARVAVPDDEGLLPRLQRRSRELPHLGVVLTLLLLLIPAAVAAALLGSRRP